MDSKVTEKLADFIAHLDYSDLTAEVIDAAKKYPEGRGIRIEVRNRNDLDVAERLAAIKMAN